MTSIGKCVHDLQELHYICIQTFRITASSFLVVKKMLGYLFGHIPNCLTFSIFQVKRLKLMFHEVLGGEETEATV